MSPRSKRKQDPTRRDVLVPVRTPGGVPGLYVATVFATDGEKKKGRHYRTAARQAKENGYEIPGGLQGEGAAPPFAIDRQDAKTTGQETLFNLAIAMNEMSDVSVDAVLESAREKLGIAQEIVDPVQTEGGAHPFAEALLEEVSAVLKYLRLR